MTPCAWFCQLCVITKSPFVANRSHLGHVNAHLHFAPSGCGERAWDGEVGKGPDRQKRTGETPTVECGSGIPGCCTASIVFRNKQDCCGLKQISTSEKDNLVIGSPQLRSHRRKPLLPRKSPSATYFRKLGFSASSSNPSPLTGSVC